MNKDIKQLVRKAKRQRGVRLVWRGGKTSGGKLEVHGPQGMYILHQTMSAGARTDMTRKELRKIGVNV